ncbi:hypothetical protein [Actinomadura montaniterrae]|uniref:Uncharacterized protein n=1 Tax=Actinomadura montaniterrae TaxID=1803903 RepID=A0A6L3VZM8_9ACTN|nr:hypothetical protein [Actinomadura montaniterrae]KAB2385952.1 hypothetical protein F9B16_09135 [Actinomadura montaniterrae]
MDPHADVVAWQNAGNMLSGAYMPAAQRAALSRAAGATHGVTTVGRAVDAAGRTGVAMVLTTPDSRIRDEYIFDQDTYQYLGQRVVVTNADQGSTGRHRADQLRAAKGLRRRPRPGGGLTRDGLISAEPGSGTSSGHGSAVRRNRNGGIVYMGDLPNGREASRDDEPSRATARTRSQNWR